MFSTTICGGGSYALINNCYLSLDMKIHNVYIQSVFRNNLLLPQGMVII